MMLVPGVSPSPLRGRMLPAMLNRRAFLGTLAFLAAPQATRAQPAAKIYRIGVLATEESPAWEGFRQDLRQLGYVEGMNTVIEWRRSEGRFERYQDFAAELVALKVDLIVASTYPATVAAKNATGTIPIVMVAVAEPVRAGLVASLARPGGNITGSTLLAGMEMVGKHLELLKAAVPNLARVAVLSNPANPMHALRLDRAAAAAQVAEAAASDPEGAGSRGVRRRLRLDDDGARGRTLRGRRRRCSSGTEHSSRTSRPGCGCPPFTS